MAKKYQCEMIRYIIDYLGSGLLKKPVLKIQFVDFWPGFNNFDNYFYKVLRTKYNLQISDKPDILIYSCFGTKFKEFDCIKVFYTGENKRADFTECDFAIGFDYVDNDRYLRLPLYILYMTKYKAYGNIQRQRTEKKARELWSSKSKFCCMVVSNPDAPERLSLFTNLSNYKTVDSGGVVLNNVGGPVADKMEFIKDYRFVIAFENASYPGYTTEKILEPFLAGCIPLYWGNPLIEKDFNKKSFLNLDNNVTEAEFIKNIIEIDTNETKAISMLAEPILANFISQKHELKKTTEFFSVIYTSVLTKNNLHYL